MKRTFFWGLIVFVCLTVVFFGQTVIRGKLPVPDDTLVGLYHPWRDLYAQTNPRGVPFKNFLITDPVRQQIPWRRIVIDSWKSGALPGWNPYTFAGTPLDANIQAAPYSPFNILFLIAPFVVGWTILIMLQPLVAGLGMYTYLSGRGRSMAASVLGGMIWGFCGFSIAWLTWGTIGMTAAWAPFMLLAIDKLTHAYGPKLSIAKRTRWAALLAVCIVLVVTGGHAQIALYVIWAAALYLWWQLAHGGSRAYIRWIGGAVFVAGVLTAIQWLPMLRMLPQTSRAVALVWQKDGWFLPWQHLAQFVAPDYFGNPATMNYWGIWNYGEFIGYVGIIPLVLAISSLFISGAPVFFSWMGIVSLFLMLPSVFSRAPFLLHLPLISVLQPTRLMVLVDLSLAVLAAYGFDALVKHKRKFWSAAAVVAIVIGALWILTFIGTRMGISVSDLGVARRNLLLPSAFFVACIVWASARLLVKKQSIQAIGATTVVVLVAVDLFRFGWKFTPFTDASYFFPETQTIKFLASQKSLGRVMSLDDRILPPNTLAYYHIETPEGYDPLAYGRYEAFISALERGTADMKQASGFDRIYTAHNIDSPLLPYMNVRYVLTLSDVSRPFLRQIFREGDTRVYEYLRMLPRVYVAEDIYTEKNPEKEIKLLIDHSPDRIGVVEQSVDVLPIPLRPDEGVRIESYTPEKIALRVSVVNQRLLILSQTYDSRWMASIDGKQSVPVRANYLFTGVVVPQGTHDVVLTYR